MEWKPGRGLTGVLPPFTGYYERGRCRGFGNHVAGELEVASPLGKCQEVTSHMSTFSHQAI